MGNESLAMEGNGDDSTGKYAVGSMNSLGQYLLGVYVYIEMRGF